MLPCLPLADASSALPVLSSKAPRRSFVAFSSRWERAAGAISETQNGGITGVAAPIYSLPRASIAEAQAWGADALIWNYINRSGDPATWINSVKEAGLEYGGVINTSPSPGGTINAQTFLAAETCYDWGGNAWSAASQPLRPANYDRIVSSGGLIDSASSDWRRTTQYQRIRSHIAFGSLCDSEMAGYKVQEAIQFRDFGAQHLQVDDPRDFAAMITQTVTGTRMMLAFKAWLLANTSSTERTAVGIPTTIPDDLVAWAKADGVLGAFFLNSSPSSVVSTTPDAYIAKNQVYLNRANSALVQIFDVWYGRFMRETINGVYASIRASCPDVAISGNMWQLTPMSFINWTASSWDYATFEVGPAPYNAGTPYDMATRMLEVVRYHYVAALSLDALGLFGVVESKPLAPNAADRQLVVSRLRQDIAVSYALGMSAMCPWDVYMAQTQGVHADGYRYMDAPELYADLYGYVRANRDIFDGYVSAPQVGFLVNSDTYPFNEGGGVYPDVATLGESGLNAVNAIMLKAMQRAVPATFVMSGSGWVNRAGVSALPRLVAIQPPSHYALQSEKLTDARAVTASSMTEADWDALQHQYSPVEVTGAENVMAFLRYNPVNDSAVVHLVNYNLTGAYNHDPKTVLVRLKPQGGGGRIKSAQLLAPGGERRPFSNGAAVTVGVITSLLFNF